MPIVELLINYDGQEIDLHPYVEKIRMEIGESIDDNDIIEELKKYLNDYHVSIDVATRGIIRKYRNPALFDMKKTVGCSDQDANIVSDDKESSLSEENESKPSIQELKNLITSTDNHYKLRYYTEMLLSVLKEEIRNASESDEDVSDDYILEIEPNRDVSESKYQPLNGPGVLFDDIAGLDEAKARIYETIILPSRRPDLFDQMRLKTNDGILLYGPPGTGKTMFAQAVATEMKAAFFTVKISELESSRPGETERNIAELFDTARAYDPAVIFFDEFESLGMSRDIGFNQDIYSRHLTELLAQIQGFKSHKGVLILIAATNRPWDIDAALLRPGRFGYKVYVGLPNKDARLHIIEHHFKGIPMDEDVNLKAIAMKTEGYNGADVAELCKRIKMQSIQRNIDEESAIISQSDVRKAIDNFHSSITKDLLDRYQEYSDQFN